MRSVLITVLVLFSIGCLWSLDIDWGLKYGIGGSELFGSDSDYELRYDLKELGASPGDLGYLRMRSQENEAGLSHNAGLYGSVLLTRKVDSIRLHTEILWQRLAYSHKFTGAVPLTNSALLSQSFADSLKGSITGTADYITIPVMFSLNQELTADEREGNYQGAFIYGGASVSMLLNQNSELEGGVNALDSSVQDFTQDSLTDSDPTSYYTSERLESGSDKFGSTKTDLIVGAGFRLKDIFQFGIGKDEFVFDLRLTFGMNKLGDSGVRDAVKLRSLIFSIGAKL